MTAHGYAVIRPRRCASVAADANYPVRFNWLFMRVLLAAVLLLVDCAGCATRTVPGPTSPPEHRAEKPAAATRVQSSAPDEIDSLNQRYAKVRAMRTLRGKATYYSESLAGSVMASGERYDPNRAQAAHRTLPFGTIVRVTRSDSNQSVVVRISDRGPFGGHGRIIDLSYAAADRLGITRAGVADVRVEVLEIPSKR